MEEEEHEEVISLEGLGGTIGCDPEASTSSSSLFLFSKKSSVEVSSTVAAFKYTLLLFVLAIDDDEVNGCWKTPES